MTRHQLSSCIWSWKSSYLMLVGSIFSRNANVSSSNIFYMRQIKWKVKVGLNTYRWEQSHAECHLERKVLSIVPRKEVTRSKEKQLFSTSAYLGTLPNDKQINYTTHDAHSKSGMVLLCLNWITFSVWRHRSNTHNLMRYFFTDLLN